jgi:Mg2+-importing ATPase
MITFGLLSSVFDYLTFGVLLLVLHAGSDLFRTSWFVESVISASLVVLVIRSRRLFFNSKPSCYLLMTTLIFIALALIIPFTPLGAVFGFVSLPISFILLMLAIVGFYILEAEMAKKVFYKHARL